jgi:hypothetical protein
MAHFDPLQWWGTYGARTPKLKELAFKLLGQPASSSCCERNWITYGFIHSLRRNKLTLERAEDLWCVWFSFLSDFAFKKVKSQTKRSYFFPGTFRKNCFYVVQF